MNEGKVFTEVRLSNAETMHITVNCVWHIFSLDYSALGVTFGYLVFSL